MWRSRNFNPRPPRGGRLDGTKVQLRLNLISIHAPREGGDIRPAAARRSMPISIHAPREGGDGTNEKQRLFAIISIHAPREGGD